MKYTVTIWTTAFILLLASPGFAQFDGGAGTEEDPYQVATLEQLQEVNNHLENHFIQTADINAEDTQNWNEGQGFLPIGSEFPFTGAFDGNDYTISNLYINRDVNSIGLIGVHAGVARNVTIVDADVTGKNQVGALVGRNEGGQVINSSSTGNITGGRRVGGLVGNNDPGQIMDSHANCNVTGERDAGGLVGDNKSGSLISGSYATGSAYTFVENGHDVGGLAGANRGGEIHNSYATGFASAAGRRAGGLVGQNQNGGIITNSYATGSASGVEIVGGLVGRNRASIATSYSTGEAFADDDTYAGGLLGSNVEEGVVETSYWDTESSGFTKGVGEDSGIEEPSDTEGFAGLTTAEMTGAAAADNMTGFDFDEVWVTTDDNYPVLYWQAEGEPTSIADNGTEIPAQMELRQNYPNPFNPATNIQFALPNTMNVQLNVYNTLGQHVATVVNGTLEAGVHTVSFDAGTLSSGMYIYQIKADDYMKTRKMLLLK